MFTCFKEISWYLQLYLIAITSIQTILCFSSFNNYFIYLLVCWVGQQNNLTAVRLYLWILIRRTHYLDIELLRYTVFLSILCWYHRYCFCFYLCYCVEETWGQLLHFQLVTKVSWLCFCFVSLYLGIVFLPHENQDQ